jgi:hypothetical protein
MKSPPKGQHKERSLTSMDFFAKAVSIRKRHAPDDSLPSLAALQLLSLTAVYICRGDIASRLVRESVEMGTRMQLFSGLDRRGTSTEALSGANDSRAAAQAAWGLFLRTTYVEMEIGRGRFQRPANSAVDTIVFTVRKHFFCLKACLLSRFLILQQDYRPLSLPRHQYLPILDQHFHTGVNSGS